MHHTKVCGLWLALLFIAGCSAAEDAATPAAVAASGTLSNGQAVLGELDTSALQEHAAQALREDRMYSPAGRNAVEYYLALRDRAPGQSGVQSALVDLQPYVLIANEQALVSGRFEEARRLTALLAQMDGAAPALPRLRQALAAAEAALVAEAPQAAQDDEALATATQQSKNPVVQVAEQAPGPDEPATAAPSLSAVRPPATASDADAATSTPAATAALAEIVPAKPPAMPVQTLPSSATAATASLPRLLKQVAPKYPQIALGRGVEGSVDVSFTIGADGSVSGARAVASRPAGIFDKAALMAVSQWRFEATGRPVSTTQTVNFTLDKKG